MNAVATKSQVGSFDAITHGSDATRGTRVDSIDLVRGLVMILMAIDHVRVYANVPAGGPTFGVFFTRWITHFVAPAFALLAGTSAYLHGRKLGDRRALSRFLVIRGAWLVLLELTVIRLAWTFNVDFAHYNLAGVIWMLGWCMVLMGACVHLPVVANAVIGCAIVALHNLLDLAPGFTKAMSDGSFGDLWRILYGGWMVQLGDKGPPLLVLYVLVPWIGVMMAGYALGAVMTLPEDRRRRILLRLGLGLTIGFVLLRAVDVYGDPRPWRDQPAPAAQAAAPSADAPPRAPAAFRFLETTKYPASLSFLLMTLGPSLILLAYGDRFRGRAAKAVRTIGRVPFFYYLLHIPVIHLLACVVSLVRYGRVDPWLFTNFPLAPGEAPQGWTWSLGLLYGIWAIAIVLLYFPSAWFARVRSTSRNRLLSFL